MGLLSDETPDRSDDWRIDPDKSLVNLYPSGDRKVGPDTPVFDANPRNRAEQRVDLDPPIVEANRAKQRKQIDPETDAHPTHIKRVDPETAALIAAYIAEHGVTRVKERTEATGKVRKFVLKDGVKLTAPRAMEWAVEDPVPYLVPYFSKQRAWDGQNLAVRNTLQRREDIALGPWTEGFTLYMPLGDSHGDEGNPRATTFLAKHDQRQPKPRQPKPRSPEFVAISNITSAYLAQHPEVLPSRGRHRVCQCGCGREIPLHRKAGSKYFSEEHQATAAAVRRLPAPDESGGQTPTTPMDWLTRRLHDLDLINGRVRAAGSDISDLAWQPMLQDSPNILAAGKRLRHAKNTTLDRYAA